MTKTSAAFTIGLMMRLWGAFTRPQEACAYCPRLPLLAPRPRTQASLSSSHVLLATSPSKKSVKSKQRTGSSSSGGGFGSSKRQTSSIADIDDDYAIFPALEARVRDTLLPAPVNTNGDIAQSLPKEVFQRIDQIYGFPSFNYDNTDTIESPPLPAAAPLSMLDLLSDETSTEDDESSTVATATTSTPPPCLADALNQLPHFAKIRVLHMDPLVLAIDDFFTADECDRYVAASLSSDEHKKSAHSNSILQSRSPTVGKDAAAKAQRTSTTFYHLYRNVPELMAKASRLLGIVNGNDNDNDDTSLNRWEEPQTVRYRRNEKFTWHLDALGPRELHDPPSGGSGGNRRQAAGQRVATLLVYLTSLPLSSGGATLFCDLGTSNSNDDTGDSSLSYLRVQPVKGMALLFFPAAGGIPDCPLDIRTLHAGQVVSTDATVNDKWIAQLWLRQRAAYTATAPPGNRQADAVPAIVEYCQQQQHLSQ